MTLWDWITKTDAGLLARISAGASIFLLLALIDLARHGRAATRWREYTFLVACVAVALVYGVINDQVTSRISWEYYAFGKGLAPVLGNLPPDPRRLSWEAAKVGLKATWTVGLLIGVACLLANNPKRDLPQLPLPRLFGRVPMVLACAVACAAALGVAGWRGYLSAWSDDFRQMVRHDEFRPYRFMAVYGIHLGGYVGGAIGTVIAVISVRRARRRVR
jgi:hypothetical protein